MDKAWIPLEMMFRNGWGTKENQEVTLAIRLKRTAFETILAEAVPSMYVAELYAIGILIP